MPIHNNEAFNEFLTSMTHSGSQNPPLISSVSRPFRVDYYRICRLAPFQNRYTSGVGKVALLLLILCLSSCARTFDG
jgi:hypothetical protein